MMTERTESWKSCLSRLLVGIASFWHFHIEFLALGYLIHFDWAAFLWLFHERKYWRQLPDYFIMLGSKSTSKAAKNPFNSSWTTLPLSLSCNIAQFVQNHDNGCGFRKTSKTIIFIETYFLVVELPSILSSHEGAKIFGRSPSTLQSAPTNVYSCQIHVNIVEEMGFASSVLLQKTYF